MYPQNVQVYFRIEFKDCKSENSTLQIVGLKCFWVKTISSQFIQFNQLSRQVTNLTKLGSQYTLQ